MLKRYFMFVTGASRHCTGLPGGVRPGTGGEPPGALPPTLPPPGPPPLRHRLLRDEPDHHRPPVRPDLALLGRGHCAGLPLALRPRHVQDRELGHHHEHVRKRFLPHGDERDPVPLPGYVPEDEQPQDRHGPRQVGQFGHLGGLSGGHAAPRFLLHHRSG